MGWHKIVMYTPHEYKQEMKKRGIAMIIFVVLLIAFVVGFGFWWSNMQNSYPWGAGGFITSGGLQAVSIFGSVCNLSGLYIGVSPGVGVNINQMQATPTNGFSGGNIINSSSPNLFSVYHYPTLICSKAGQYYSADINVYATDTFTGGNPITEVVTGKVWGNADACQFSQDSISCNS